MARTRTTLLASAAVVAALPATADAMIQIDRGIAGARLNNTPAQVRAALGKPAKIVRGTNDFGPYTQYRYAGGVVVSFQGRRRVTAASTTGLGDRTTRGVGVGSREATVKAKVKGVKCETIAGARTCHTGSQTAGQRITDFLIRKGRVTRVTVGFVID